MSIVIPSLIRTATPIAVGALLAWLTARGVDLPEGAERVATEALVALLALTWYAVARALERAHPRWGWLLGHPSAPRYGATVPAGEARALADAVDRQLYAEGATTEVHADLRRAAADASSRVRDLALEAIERDGAR